MKKGFIDKNLKTILKREFRKYINFFKKDFRITTKTTMLLVVLFHKQLA